MAIVGDKTWEDIIIKADGLVFGEKDFDISQLDEAWEWLEGGDLSGFRPRNDIETRDQSRSVDDGRMSS